MTTCFSQINMFTYVSTSYTENSSNAGIPSYSSGFLTTSKLLDTKHVFNTVMEGRKKGWERKKKRRRKGKTKGTK